MLFFIRSKLCQTSIFCSTLFFRNLYSSIRAMLATPPHFLKKKDLDTFSAARGEGILILSHHISLYSHIPTLSHSSFLIPQHQPFILHPLSAVRPTQQKKKHKNLTPPYFRKSMKKSYNPKR